MDNILVCESCGAKMRVRLATLKIVKEIKCAKCRKTVVVPPEMKAAAKNGTLNISATKPLASESATIKPSVAKVMATPVSKAMPQPVASLEPAPVAMPQPIIVQPAMPVQPISAVQPNVQPTNSIQPVVPVQPNVPPPTAPPMATSGLIEARIAKLETTVTELEARIGGLLKIEQQTARKLATELEAL